MIGGRRTDVVAGATWVMLVLAPACGPAAEEVVVTGAEADASSTSPDGAMLANLRTTLDVAEEKLMGLANAVPEEDYGWQPMAGVRSVAGVFLHVAADNYFLPVLAGAEAPTETGITLDYSTVRAYENQELDKASIIREMEASFAFLHSALDGAAGDLSREIRVGSDTLTTGALWTQTVTHLHEHLGQAIAYARANEVVPPWSM